MMLLIHDNQLDPVVSAIMATQNLWQEPIVSLSIDQILKEATIYDEIDDGNPVLSWTFPDIGTITNSRDVKLINRMRAVPRSIFSDFHPDDQEYAQTEFHAYMTFALNAFPVKLNAPGFFGLAGNQYPLPLQWDLIKKSSLGVSVPSYYLGAAAHCPFDGERDPLIFNHIYGYRHWKPGGVPTGTSTFAVLKPQGFPYFCLVAGTQALLMEGPHGQALDPDLADHVRSLGIKAAATLGSTIAEILFFIEGHHITFGVLDITPAATVRHPQFQSVVYQGLKDFFERYTHVL